MEEKNNKESTYVLKEVVTDTALAIGKSDSEEVLSDKAVLAEILNKLDIIEKALLK